MKKCTHNKKYRGFFSAGWNNTDIVLPNKKSFGIVSYDVICWCSKCGSINVWKDQNTKKWIHPA